MTDEQSYACSDCGAKLLPWEGDRYGGICEGCDLDRERMERDAEENRLEAEDEMADGEWKGSIAVKP